MIKFTIDGKPQPKERPRKGTHGNFYTPSSTKKYEEIVRWSYLAAKTKHKNFNGLVVDKPISVFIEINVKKEKNNKLIFPTKKTGDVDNIAKSILDSLNGFAYIDDSQIVCLNVIKKYADRDYVSVEMEELCY